MDDDEVVLVGENNEIQIVGEQNEVQVLQEVIAVNEEAPLIRQRDAQQVIPPPNAFQKQKIETLNIFVTR